MKKYLSLIFTFSLFFIQKNYAQKVYDFNALCQQAYDNITALKINAGQLLINEERKKNPDNLIPDLLEGYIDFFVLFFNEDPQEYKNRKPHFDTRFSRLESGNESSPYYNYCRSVAYLQKATIEIKFSDQWHAAWDFRKAFALEKQNRKDFPNFLPNDMIFAPMEIIVDVIPDGYKTFTSLLGLKGSMKDGLQRMNNFVNSSDPSAKQFFNEAIFYYCYLVFYIQNKPEDAFRFLEQKKLDVVNNQLFAYMAANLAINNKQTDFAKNILLHRNTSPEYMYTPVWDYELAFVKIHHLEIDDAIKYFQSFLKNFKGKFYLKDTYEKLAWCFYLQGNTAAAKSTMQQIISKGSTETDADKQALQDAKSGIFPNIILLKARLLSDGGYNHEALAMLAGKSTEDFISDVDKLEFSYRLARIYDDLNRSEDAVQAYLTTIKLGEKRTEYYASRAALQVGNIYENQQKKSLAVAFYQKCLSMGNHEYKNSIDQKAKAGIERCKN